VAITFAAGNQGQGPSYWNNVFSTALAWAGGCAVALPSPNSASSFRPTDPTQSMDDAARFALRAIVPS
jgi:hypothetical protein